jgi:hypothetical protein
LRYVHAFTTQTAQRLWPMAAPTSTSVSHVGCSCAATGSMATCCHSLTGSCR